MVNNHFHIFLDNFKLREVARKNCLYSVPEFLSTALANFGSSDAGAGWAVELWYALREVFTNFNKKLCENRGNPKYILNFIADSVLVN